MVTPYEKLLEMMRHEGCYYNPLAPSIGKVLSLSPLKILFQGIGLDESELKINRTLRREDGYSFETGSEVLIIPVQNIFIVDCEVIG